MAGSSIIGALRVVIGADTAALERGLQDAQSGLAAFANTAKISGAVIAGAMAGLVGGITAGVKGALDEADKLGKTAQSIGMPVEELSKLKYAADLSDVSLGVLSSSMQALNRNMVAVAAGGGGKAAAAFRAMHIEVKNADGSLKSQNQILAEVADKFAGYEDGAAKSALATAIFGRAGAAMIPMLNEGSAGLKNAADEAERLGIVIGKDTAAAAQNFHDNLTRLSKQTDGLFVQLSANLAPALDELSRRLVASAGDGEAMKTVADIITKALGFVAQEIAEVSIRLHGLAQEWAAFSRMMTSWSWSEIRSSFTEFMAVGDRTDEKVRQMKDGFSSFFTALDAHKDPMQRMSDDMLRQTDALGKLVEAWLRTPAPIMESGKALQATEQQMDKSTAAMVRFFNQGEKTIAGLTAETYTIGMSVGQHAAFKYAIEGITKAKQEGKDQDQETRDGILRDAIQIGELTERLEGMRSAWNFASQSMDRGASAIVDVAMGAKSGKEAFRDFAMSVIRDVGQMIAKFIILNTVVKPLFGGFLSGGGFGGLLGLSGLGFAAGGTLAMADGGSFTVGGGSSLTDNQIVPMKLAAGERVRVESNYNHGNGGGDSVIRVEGIDARKFYSGDNLRALMEQMQIAIGNGRKLKFT